MLSSLEPLLRALVDRVLPDIAGAMLGPFVVAEIAAEAERMADTPMIVAVSPENRAAVEAALPDAAGLPVELTEDATLADGQVRFAFGSGERTLDLDALLSTIQRLMTDFLSTEDERKVSNG
jgi:flagellar assembly protein FliH